MRMLCRLAELSMSLAEISAEDAAAADPTLEPAAPTRHAQPERPRTATRQEHVLAFSRLSRIIHAAVSLHAALEAGPRPVAQARRAAGQAAGQADGQAVDYRHKFVADAFEEVGRLSPDLQICPQETSQALSARLADPEHEDDCLATLASLFARVAADIGLPPHTRPGPIHASLFECLAMELPPEPPD